MLSSSNIPISDKHPIPRPMTDEEIQGTIISFVQAAKNAISAGFDGVELHGANGYLIDQFLQDTCNQRSDRWGGSVENRSRFCLEVTEAVCEAIGPDRTAIRLSPFSDFQGMGMKDPALQFSHLISQLRTLNLAYLHLIEPRISGNTDRLSEKIESLDFALEAWQQSGPIVLAGGYTADKANKALDTNLRGETVAFAFGRYFISNPDLPFRLVNNLALTHYNRETFYKAKSPDGYNDYAFSESWTRHLSQPSQSSSKRS
jgi:NADPH2 dehydrogenase